MAESEADANTDSAIRPSEHRGYATLDQEAWTIDRLWTLVCIVKDLENIGSVGADRRAINRAKRGAVHGTAVEIFDTLGLKCEGVNVDLGPSDEHLRYDPDDV